MLEKRSFSLSGHRTSVALEPAFWTALEGMAVEEGVALAVFVAGLDAVRPAEAPLASTLRLAALQAAQRGGESGSSQR